MRRERQRLAFPPLTERHVIRFRAQAGPIAWSPDELRRCALDPEMGRILHVAVLWEDDTSITARQGRSLGVDRAADIAEFLPLWRTEEADHARALHCLLEGRDHEAPAAATAAIARRRLVVARVPVRAMARLPQTAFVFCVLGAAAEYLATTIYAALAKEAEAAVLQRLLRSIARQEARHFAFFQAAARIRGERMGAVNGAVARRMTASVWTPIGVPTLGRDRWFETFAALLDDEHLRNRLLMMDRVIDSIPHLTDLHLMRRFLEARPVPTS